MEQTSTTRVTTLSVMYDQVGQWSRENFGDQKGLGCLAPVLGACEELGELFAAHNMPLAMGGERREMIVDAIGDIAIYLMDFGNRDGMDTHRHPFYVMVPGPEMYVTGQLDPLEGMAIYLGKLAHCVLKRHQGIRGYADGEKYETERNEALIFFHCHLRKYAATYGVFEALILDVWNRDVAKRNWIANPVQG